MTEKKKNQKGIFHSLCPPQEFPLSFLPLHHLQLILRAAMVVVLLPGAVLAAATESPAHFMRSMCEKSQSDPKLPRSHAAWSYRETRKARR